jgi:hypothetical protein
VSFQFGDTRSTLVRTGAHRLHTMSSYIISSTPRGGLSRIPDANRASGSRLWVQITSEGSTHSLAGISDDAGGVVV